MEMSGSALTPNHETRSLVVLAFAATAGVLVDFIFGHYGDPAGLPQMVLRSCGLHPYIVEWR